MARLRPSLVLVAGLAATVVAGPAGSQTVQTRGEALGEAIERNLPFKGGVLAPKACVLMSIACGQTVSSSLTNDDCPLDDGTLVDFYEFTGQSGQRVTVTLTSNAFDAFLFLLDPTPEVVATDDDGGGGTDARLVHTLDQTSNEWAIAANAFFPDQTGPYTLSLQCSGGPPPPPPPPSDGFFSDPSYPDFRFRVTIGEPGDQRTGTREPSCLPETVCVSGALPGRSEAFLRIIGPRPNGFLWPTIVRFTPSRLVVDVRQVSTGETQTYVLPAVPPGVDDLPGLQDRTGFLP